MHRAHRPTIGAAGNQAVVSSIAAENPASTPKTLTGARPMIGTTARITVITARFARPFHPATRSGLRNAASAAPEDATAPPAPMPPAMSPATTAAGAGTSAAAPKPIVATTRPMRATASRRGPAQSLATARPVTAVASSAAVTIQLAVSTSAPSAVCRAAIMYGERLTPR